MHAALGNPTRLNIVDALALGDHTVNELRELSGLTGNLLAHHLDVLEGAGVIERRRSEGDQRRKYVVLRRDLLVDVGTHALRAARPLFVCTHNSARSQFAAAMWSHRTGSHAQSAGTDPADRIHPKAVAVAAELGIDLGRAVPVGYEAVTIAPDLVISVCDRAREAPPPPGSAPRLHWSIPDPVLVGTDRAFRDAFSEIAARIDRLAEDR